MNAFVDMRRDVVALRMKFECTIPWTSCKRAANSIHPSEENRITGDEHARPNPCRTACEFTSASHVQGQAMPTIMIAGILRGPAFYLVSVVKSWWQLMCDVSIAQECVPVQWASLTAPYSPYSSFSALNLTFIWPLLCVLSSHMRDQPADQWPPKFPRAR